MTTKINVTTLDNVLGFLSEDHAIRAETYLRFIRSAHPEGWSGQIGYGDVAYAIRRTCREGGRKTPFNLEAFNELTGHEWDYVQL
jgi:hypothetical protein